MTASTSPGMPDELEISIGGYFGPSYRVAKVGDELTYTSRASGDDPLREEPLLPTTEFVELDGAKVHIYELFALTNFLLCSAVPGKQLDETAFVEMRVLGAQRGKSTKTMRKNCAEHFRAAMEILEPTVMVAQGKGVRKWLEGALDGFDRIDDSLPIERVRIGPLTTLLATFGHPSAPSRDNWGQNEKQRYLLETVKPTVEVLLDLVGGSATERIGVDCP